MPNEFLQEFFFWFIFRRSILPTPCLSARNAHSFGWFIGKIPGFPLEKPNNRQSFSFLDFSLLSRCGQSFSRIVIIRIRDLSRREEEVSRLRANQLAFYHSCFSLPRRDNMMEKLTYQIRNLLATKIIPKKEWTIDTRRDGWWGYFDPIPGLANILMAIAQKGFCPVTFEQKMG